MKKTFAIVKTPSQSFINAINDWYVANDSSKDTFVDFEKALWQHKQYIYCLKKTGVKVICLPAEESFPDGCFTQDPVIIFGKHALVNKQFAVSRRGEYKSIIDGLRKFGFSFSFMKKGFCDGGDILMVKDKKKIYIGKSKRTNKFGFIEIKKTFKNFGYQFEQIKVTKCLHLLSGLTYLTNGNFLISNLIENDQINKIVYKANKIINVPPEENYAVNALTINNTVIMPKGFPFTQNQIEKLGYKILTVEMSEFEKADGGVTCLSLLFEI